MIIGIDEKGNVIIYINRAYVVHSNRKVYSGLYITMWCSRIINISKKLRLVIVSLTKTEIVSNRERFLKCIWFQYFWLAQSNDPNKDILLQDTKSCILLHKKLSLFYQKR